MNPTIIPVKSPQGAKMSCHPPDNPGHSSHRLKNNTSVEPFSFSHLLWIVGCEPVVGSSNEFDAQISKTVPKSCRRLVLILDRI